MTTIRATNSGRCSCSIARFDNGPIPTHRTRPSAAAQTSLTAEITSSPCRGTSAGPIPSTQYIRLFPRSDPAATRTSGRPTRSSRYRTNRARSPPYSSLVITNFNSGTRRATTTTATVSSGSPPMSVSIIIGARAIAGTPTAGGGPPRMSGPASSSNSSKLSPSPASAVHSRPESGLVPSPISTSAYSCRVHNILYEHLSVTVALAPVVRSPDRRPVLLRHLGPVQGLLQQFRVLLVGTMHERVEKLRQPRIGRAAGAPPADLRPIAPGPIVQPWPIVAAGIAKLGAILRQIRNREQVHHLHTFAHLKLLQPR